MQYLSSRSKGRAGEHECKVLSCLLGGPTGNLEQAASTERMGRTEFSNSLSLVSFGVKMKGPEACLLTESVELRVVHAERTYSRRRDI